MVDIVRAHVPKARESTFYTVADTACRHVPSVSCLTANAASRKAILKAALDEMLRDNAADVNTRLFYFPSYEIVQELFPKRFQGRRPPSRPRDHSSTIMKIFEGVYCKNETTLADADRPNSGEPMRAAPRNIEQLAGGSSEEDAAACNEIRKRRKARRSANNVVGD